MTKTPSIADLKSGFLIFLIALPLCLGISMASGCPPITGVITAMVGGLISSFLGSARLSIKGPAAGLIVIILGAVQELGQGDAFLGYKRCLGVAVVAAIFQIIFSKLNAGRIGKMMPSAVIYGMLAAIGIIIIAKQLHVLFGVIPMSKTPLELIAEVPHSMANANPEIVIIGLLTLFVALFVPMIPVGIAKKIPPAMISLALVLPLALYWHLDSQHNYQFLAHTFEIGPKFLVTLPENIFASLVFPDFSALSSFIGWKYVIMLALIGSIESLLTVMALDKDSDLNKDLFSVGFGNLCAAMIGGIPMISEVVRSKANIDAGAQSQWSNFFHGGFLLIAVTMLTPVIHEIPLSALAALLIITGFRLSSPKEFYHAYQVGLDELAVFMTTLFITLKEDLLMGVIAGIILKIVIDVALGRIKLASVAERK
ncbi:MAG: SulP family inorganic anion transporter [Myxococcaceae bacterium]